MRHCVTRRLIVIHAALQLKTTDLDSIFKTGKIQRSLEKSGAMVGLIKLMKKLVVFGRWDVLYVC